MLSRARTLDPLENREIERWCHENAQYYGLFVPMCQMASSFLVRARYTGGLLRVGPVGSAFARTGPSRMIKEATVLFDASLGGYHSALWLPVAESLLSRRIRLGFVYQGSRLPAALTELESNYENGGWGAFCLPDSALWSTGPKVSFPPNELVPWKGSFGMSVRILVYHSRVLAAAWRAILERSEVQVVVTTLPFSPWHSGLVLAASDLGISTVYLMPALPSAAWGFPICDTAVVWSPLGKKALQELGWGEKEILTAGNPTIPLPNQCRALRKVARAQRGLAEREFLILVIGQPSCDRGFVVDRYAETWAAVGKGLGTICNENEVQVALRPHHSDGKAETEGFLRSRGLGKLVVWREAPLLEDLACADLVVGMHSTAMEEAFLAGKPVVQVYAGDAEPEVDFRILGCPLARNAEELAEIVENRAWMATRQQPEVWPAPGDLIANILERR